MNQEVQDYIGFELYTELPGHAWFLVTADFAEAAVDPVCYNTLVIWGGRFVERLTVEGDDSIAVLVKTLAGPSCRAHVPQPAPAYCCEHYASVRCTPTNTGDDISASHRFVGMGRRRCAGIQP
jgi:hypothetical protein